MSSPSAAKIAANQANAQHSTGPRTEAGQAASAQNATKSGLFAAKDFVRPGEQPLYEQLNEHLRADLAPAGTLEHHHVDEIRRAMWRLRRCGEVEAAMVVTCAEANPENIPDAMQNEATAKLQASVDRARADCHRLINRSTAELRKIQTERHIRNETTEAGTDLSYLGASDTQAINKAVEATARTDERNFNRERRLDATILKHQMEQAYVSSVAPPPTTEPIPSPAVLPTPAALPTQVTKQSHQERNSRCDCGSGLKYKRCCARQTASLPKAA